MNVRIEHWIAGAAVIAVAWYVCLTAAINATSPSTELIDPQIETAEPCGRDLPCVYVGDEFYLRYFIVRHQLNGTCTSDVHRYAEEVGGKRNGKRHLLSHVELNFVGKNDISRPRWPPANSNYRLEYSVDADNIPIPNSPLLPEGVDEQRMCFFNTNRYYCNFLDYIVPRYMQGGARPNESPSVCAYVRRSRETKQ